MAAITHLLDTSVYARIKAETLRAGLVIGEFDLLIGATALANKLTLATLNTKDFMKIPELVVEDWSLALN